MDSRWRSLAVTTMRGRACSLSSMGVSLDARQGRRGLCPARIPGGAQRIMLAPLCPRTGAEALAADEKQHSAIGMGPRFQNLSSWP